MSSILWHFIMYILLYIQPEDDLLRAETCCFKLFKIRVN